jgi:uncharacterized protein
LRLLLTLLAAAALASAAPALDSEPGVAIPMRDGVALSANIFRPDVEGRLPAILIRTPYGKGTDPTPNYRAFVDSGYAVVVQDVRGRYASEGRFDLFHQEMADGEDTLNWIARQDWSNGNIGMIGGSYLGIVQWKAALLNNPHLKAIFPSVSGCDDYFDRFYSPGGALKLGQRLEWMAENVRAPGFHRPDLKSFIFHLPLRTADRAATGRRVDFWQTALDHPSYDSFWNSVGTRHLLEKIHVPVFSVGGWYDNFVESDLEAFRLMRRNGRAHRILIGPWPHDLSARFAGVDFGPDAAAPLRALQLEWFDYWLKGIRHGAEPVTDPPVRLFVMGANRWRNEEHWPLSRARITPFFLSGNGRANSLNGDGRLERESPGRQKPDHYSFDPKNPVPTTGGAICCNSRLLPWGPMDQRGVEKRHDVLVYTSEVLARDTEVTGPVRVVLYVSTSQPDTDFTAKLVDVFPDGTARNLTDGILRLRYRQSLEKPEPARAGHVYPITIDAGVTSNQFGKGHSIRVEISSSNFPRFDRNPNTGRPIADERELRRAIQTIYHDRERPSHVLLPVIP